MTEIEKDKLILQWQLILQILDHANKNLQFSITESMAIGNATQIVSEALNKIPTE